MHDSVTVHMNAAPQRVWELLSDVTESFTLARTWWLKLYWACLGWARGKTNRDGMRRTLEAVRDDAEAGSTSA